MTQSRHLIAHAKPEGFLLRAARRLPALDFDNSYFLEYTSVFSERESRRWGPGLAPQIFFRRTSHDG
jgi:hypothetical protein